MKTYIFVWTPLLCMGYSLSFSSGFSRVIIGISLKKSNLLSQYIRHFCCQLISSIADPFTKGLSSSCFIIINHGIEIQKLLDLVLTTKPYY